MPFIVFEGCDGSGKTTLLRKVADKIKKDNPKAEVITCREPGSTETGEQIRSIYLDKSLSFCPHTELFLTAAARSQLVNEVIQPALDSGAFVLCDRYYYSSLAYQGYGRGLNMDFVQEVSEMSCLGVYPNTVYLVKTPKEVCLERLIRKGSNGRDRIESEGDLINRVFEFYDMEFIRNYMAGWQKLVVVDGVTVEKK